LQLLGTEIVAPKAQKGSISHGVLTFRNCRCRDLQVRLHRLKSAQGADYLASDKG